jgi:hypothetical protein
VQPLDRALPAIVIDEIVPVRNQVAQRAPLVAERYAAVHAARALLLQLAGRIRQIHFAPVLEALGDRARRMLLPLDFYETGRLAHVGLWSLVFGLGWSLVFGLWSLVVGLGAITALNRA